MVGKNGLHLAILAVSVAVAAPAMAEESEPQPPAPRPATGSTAEAADTESGADAPYAEPEREQPAAPQSFMESEMVLSCPRVVCRCVAPTAGQVAVPAPTAQPTPPQPVLAPPQPAAPSVAAAPAEQPAAQVQARPGWHNVPAPVGGYLLQRRRVGIGLDLGFPFLDLRVDYGATSRFQVGVGYRGLYSLTHAGYAAFRIGLYQNDRRTIALSLVGLGGYSGTRTGYAFTTSLVGGEGGFGELQFHISARRRRNMLLVSTGVKVAQVLAHDCDDTDDWSGDYCGQYLFDGGGGVLAVAAAEIGWAIRAMNFVSLFVSAGVDLYLNGGNTPVMPRGRFGLLFDF